MGKHETIVPYDPPIPTARDVRVYRHTLEASLDVLRASRAGLALASARGDTAARENLAALRLKIRAVEFEIECNHAAFELAEKQDGDAWAAWRASILMLDPEEAIAGIGKDGCCTRCTPNIPGGCVLSANKSSTCMHPIRELRSFHNDEAGVKIFPYRDDPQAKKIFEAACTKLKVPRGGAGKLP
jgi:hypothetical protein